VATPLPPDGQRTVVRARRKRARLAVCTLAVGRHRELLAESVPTLAASARLHGWDLVVSSEDLAEGRPTSWAKVRLLAELLADYEYVWWVDADALIVDPKADVLAEVAADCSHHAWFAHHAQEHDDRASFPNAGVVLIRRDPRSTALLDAMWGCEHLIDHNWWENASLIELLGRSLEPPYLQVSESPWSTGIGRLDLRWNSVPGYCESPFPVVHHHARADHDDFERRRQAMEDDRLTVLRRYPEAFSERSAASRLRLRGRR
jgi:hypothetical protein